MDKSSDSFEQRSQPSASAPAMPFVPIAPPVADAPGSPDNPASGQHPSAAQSDGAKQLFAHVKGEFEVNRSRLDPAVAARVERMLVMMEAAISSGSAPMIADATLNLVSALEEMKKNM